MLSDSFDDFVSNGHSKKNKRKRKLVKFLEGSDSEENITDEKKRLVDEIFDKSESSELSRRDNFPVRFQAEEDFSESEDIDDFIVNDNEKYHQPRNLRKKQSRLDAASRSKDDFFTSKAEKISNKEDFEAFAEAQAVFGDEFDMMDLKSFDKNLQYDDVSFDDNTLIQDEKVPITDIFEPAILEKNFLTDIDELIKTTDVPERFQSRSFPVCSFADSILNSIRFNKFLKDKSELEMEADWIFDNYFDKEPILETLSRRYAEIDKDRYYDSIIYKNYSYVKENRSYIVASIEKILKLIRDDFFDVPFISEYKLIFLDEKISENDLWQIYYADNEWMQLSKKIDDLLIYAQDLIDFFEYYKSGEAEFPVDLKWIRVEDFLKIIERELGNICRISSHEKYEYYYNLFQMYFCSIAHLFTQFKLRNSEVVLKKEVRVSNFYIINISKGLDIFLKHFGLDPYAVAENIYDGSLNNLQTKEFENVLPNELVKNFIEKNDTSLTNFLNEGQLLDTAVKLYAYDLAHQPKLLISFQEYYIKHVLISCKPTLKGQGIIDEMHPCSSFKFLKDKPISYVSSEQYIKLYHAVKDGLLLIEFYMNDNMYHHLMKLWRYCAHIDNDSQQDTIDYTNQQDFKNNDEECWDDDKCENNKNIEFKEKNDDNKTTYTSWIDLRYKAIKIALDEHLIPKFNSKLFEKLYNEANEDLCNVTANIFHKHINVAPLQSYLFSSATKIKSQDQDQDSNSSDLIMVITFPRYQVDRNRKTNKKLSLLKQQQRLKERGAVEDEFLEKDILDNKFIENKRKGYCLLMNAYGKVVKDIPISNVLISSLPWKKLEHDERLELDRSLEDIEFLLNKYFIHSIYVPLLFSEYNNFFKQFTYWLDNYEPETFKYKPKAYLINPFIVSNEAKLEALLSDDQKKFYSIQYNYSFVIGKYILNPLLEVSRLYKCGLDHFRDLLDPYQKYLNKDRLKELFDQKIIITLSKVGLNTDFLKKYENYDNLLEYLPGFGPRKANLFSRLISKHCSNELHSRSQLVTNLYLGPKIFINCSAFINVVQDPQNSMMDILDSTRIHPEHYEFVKMLISFLKKDSDDSLLDDHFSMLESLRMDPHLMDSLTQVDTIDKLQNNLIGEEYISLLNCRSFMNFIKNELLNGFVCEQYALDSLTNEEIFWVLVNGGARIDIDKVQQFQKLDIKNYSHSQYNNEDLFIISPGQVVHMYVTAFLYKSQQDYNILSIELEKHEITNVYKCPSCFELISHSLKITYDHIKNSCPGYPIGIRGSLDGYWNKINGVVLLKNISDNPPNNIKERVKVGNVVTGRILYIDFKRLQVFVSCKSSDLASSDNLKEFMYPRDAYFDLESKQKLETSLTTTFKKTEETLENNVVYHKRVIKHDDFQNLNYEKAESYLEDKEIGYYIFRPSSKGIDSLTLSWKCCEKTYQHVLIKEMEKPDQYSIGKVLVIDDEEYSDLDEIVANYLAPIITILLEVRKSKFFNEAEGGSRSKINDILKLEKKQNPNRIPYVITPAKGFPGKFTLCYLPRSTPNFEYFSIKKDGIKYRNKFHSSVEELIKYFKYCYSHQTGNTGEESQGSNKNLVSPKN